MKKHLLKRIITCVMASALILADVGPALAAPVAEEDVEVIDLTQEAEPEEEAVEAEPIVAEPAPAAEDEDPLAGHSKRKGVSFINHASSVISITGSAVTTDCGKEKEDTFENQLKNENNKENDWWVIGEHTVAKNIDINIGAITDGAILFAVDFGDDLDEDDDPADYDYTFYSSKDKAVETIALEAYDHDQDNWGENATIAIFDASKYAGPVDVTPTVTLMPSVGTDMKEGPYGSLYVAPTIDRVNDNKSQISIQKVDRLKEITDFRNNANAGGIDVYNLKNLCMDEDPTDGYNLKEIRVDYTLNDEKLDLAKAPVTTFASIHALRDVVDPDWTETIDDAVVHFGKNYNLAGFLSRDYDPAKKDTKFDMSTIFKNGTTAVNFYLTPVFEKPETPVTESYTIEFPLWFDANYGAREVADAYKTDHFKGKISDTADSVTGTAIITITDQELAVDGWWNNEYAEVVYPKDAAVPVGTKDGYKLIEWRYTYADPIHGISDGQSTSLKNLLGEDAFNKAVTDNVFKNITKDTFKDKKDVAINTIVGKLAAYYDDPTLVTDKEYTLDVVFDFGKDTKSAYGGAYGINKNGNILWYGEEQKGLYTAKWKIGPNQLISSITGRSINFRTTKQKHDQYIGNYTVAMPWGVTYTDGVTAFYERPTTYNGDDNDAYQSVWEVNNMVTTGQALRYDGNDYACYLPKDDHTAFNYGEKIDPKKTSIRLDQIFSAEDLAKIVKAVQDGKTDITAETKLKVTLTDKTYKEHAYTVDLDGGLGNGVNGEWVYENTPYPFIETVTSGALYALEPLQVGGRDEYVFDGWYYDKEFTKQLVTGTSIAYALDPDWVWYPNTPENDHNKDFKVYAKWKSATMNIVFWGGEGTSVVSHSAIVDVNKVYKIPTAEQVDKTWKSNDKVFLGWADGIPGKTADYAAGDEKAFTWADAEFKSKADILDGDEDTVYFYAVWASSDTKFKVQYVLGEGIDSINKEGITKYSDKSYIGEYLPKDGIKAAALPRYDKKKKINEIVLKDGYEGYELYLMKSDRQAPVKITPSKGLTAAQTNVAGLTIEIRGVGKVYTVTYDPNKKAVVGSKVSGKKTKVKVRYGDTFITQSEYLFTAKDYEYHQWRTNPYSDSSRDFDPSEKENLVNICKVGGVEYPRNITLYADWHGEARAKFVSPYAARVTNTVDSWDDVGVWNLYPYTTDYEDYNYSPLSKKISLPQRVVAVERDEEGNYVRDIEDLKFTGWRKAKYDKRLGTWVAANAKNVKTIKAGDTNTYIATFGKKTYNVTMYDWNGKVLKTGKYTFGAKAKALPKKTPKRAGYTFVGWTTRALGTVSGNSQYDILNTVIIKGNEKINDIVLKRDYGLSALDVDGVKLYAVYVEGTSTKYEFSINDENTEIGAVKGTYVAKTGKITALKWSGVKKNKKYTTLAALGKDFAAYKAKKEIGDNEKWNFETFYISDTGKGHTAYNDYGVYSKNGNYGTKIPAKTYGDLVLTPIYNNGKKVIQVIMDENVPEGVKKKSSTKVKTVTMIKKSFAKYAQGTDWVWDDDIGDWVLENYYYIDSGYWTGYMKGANAFTKCKDKKYYLGSTDPTTANGKFQIANFGYANAYAPTANAGWGLTIHGKNSVTIEKGKPKSLKNQMVIQMTDDQIYNLPKLTKKGKTAKKGTKPTYMLYAQWTLRTNGFGVILNNGGVVNPSIDGDSDAVIKYDADDWWDASDWDDGLWANGNFTLPTLKAKGYTFKGWKEIGASGTATKLLKAGSIVKANGLDKRYFEAVWTRTADDSLTKLSAT